MNLYPVIKYKYNYKILIYQRLEHLYILIKNLNIHRIMNIIYLKKWKHSDTLIRINTYTLFLFTCASISFIIYYLLLRDFYYIQETELLSIFDGFIIYKLFITLKLMERNQVLIYKGIEIKYSESTIYQFTIYIFIFIM